MIEIVARSSQFLFFSETKGLPSPRQLPELKDYRNMAVQRRAKQLRAPRNVGHNSKTGKKITSPIPDADLNKVRLAILVNRDLLRWLTSRLIPTHMHSQTISFVHPSRKHRLNVDHSSYITTNFSSHSFPKLIIMLNYLLHKSGMHSLVASLRTRKSPGSQPLYQTVK